VGKKGTGLKDTARNIRKRPEFTVNICNEALAEKMVQTSGDYPHGTSEFDEVGLEAVPSDLIAAPRIGGAPVQMECHLYKTLNIEESGATVIFGRVIRYHIDAAVIDDNGLVNIHKLKPVGRLGGQEYCRVNDVFEIPRPEL
jgi:flavin reductase (DIM6/NTAB) family NADH-FMN oxidoreductase RutF